MTVNGSAFQRCWLIFLPQRDKKEQTDSVLILQEQQKEKKKLLLPSKGHRWHGCYNHERNSWSVHQDRTMYVRQMGYLLKPFYLSNIIKCYKKGHWCFRKKWLVKTNKQDWVVTDWSDLLPISLKSDQSEFLLLVKLDNNNCRPPTGLKRNMKNIPIVHHSV